MLTKRQIFETVRDHLLSQGERSEKDNRCLYRGPDGLKCAVGCLINDEFYSETFENIAIAEVMYSYESLATLGLAVEAFKAALTASGVPLTLDIVRMLHRLQQMHDGLDPTLWSQSLEQIEYDFFPQL